MLLRYRGDISVPAMPHARRQLQSDIPLRGHEAKALGGPGILRREALNFRNSLRLLGSDSNYQIAIGINEQLMHLINVDELMMS